MSAPEPLELGPGEILTTWREVSNLDIDAWEVKYGWTCSSDRRFDRLGLVLQDGPAIADASPVVVRPRKVMVSIERSHLRMILDMSSRVSCTHPEFKQWEIAAIAAEAAIAEAES